MPQLPSNGSRKRYAYIKSSANVFSEVIKLSGVKFHNNKPLVDEAEQFRTIYDNNTFIKSSNLCWMSFLQNQLQQLDQTEINH